MPIAVIMAGIELGLIYALRAGKSNGTSWPVTLMAVLAALFLALGVLRHYWDIYIHRTVRGISFIFCAIDALGDLTSLLALLFQPDLDVLGMIIYGLEFVLWMGIFACGGYYNLTPWLKQKSFSRDRNVVMSGNSDDQGTTGDTMPASGIAISNLPSSTSAFRTSSASLHSVHSRVGRSSLHSIDT